MAQTGYTPISLYYTTTASAVPTSGNLVNGELALNINTADGKLFYKDSAGVVQVLATKASASGSFVNLSYTGTFTGGTGVVNLGSGQFYKDTAGNVGIGTIAPSKKLEVSGQVAIGTLAVSGNYAVTYNPETAGNNVFWTRSDSYFAWGQGGDPYSSTELMRLDYTGNLLLGTSGSDATNKLQVAGRIGATGFANSNGAYAAFSASVLQGYPTFGFSQYLLVENQSNNSYGMSICTTYAGTQAERCRIDSSGNLLVGTTSVNGSISNTSLLTAGRFSTASGNTGTIASNVATTIATLSYPGLYTVVARLPAGAGSPALYTAFATVVCDGAASRIDANNGTAFLITLSGNSIQVTQISGATQANVSWSILNQYMP